MEDKTNSAAKTSETTTAGEAYIRTEPHEGVCPACGYCPRCGRRGPIYPAPVTPITPWYPQPFWPRGPYEITWTDVATVPSSIPTSSRS